MPPVLQSSSEISKFYASTDSEHNVHKAGIKNKLLIGLELVPPNWEPAVIATDWEYP